MEKLSALEKLLSYQFRNTDLLEEAVTHRSYLNENPHRKGNHNERLEFLGDAVLELVITEALFDKFPKEPEGRLTMLRAALVNYQMLSKLSIQIELGKFLLMSRGEAKDIGRAREVILANAFEAVIGALYLDGGYSAVKELVLRIVFPAILEVLERGLEKDPKSLLQEKAQADLRVTPSYRLLKESGPDHKKVFEVAVYLGDREVASGEGPSKQEAELDAARRALAVKNWQ